MHPLLYQQKEQQNKGEDISSPRGSVADESSEDHDWFLNGSSLFFDGKPQCGNYLQTTNLNQLKVRKHFPLLIHSFYLTKGCNYFEEK